MGKSMLLNYRNDMIFDESGEMYSFDFHYYTIANIVSIILLCLMVMMIFEARQDKIGLYIIFTLASCINCYKNRKGGIKHE